MPKEMIQVFLSSTGRDLYEHRDAVYESIHRMDEFHCVRMEDFGARTQDTLEFCLNKVRSSDVLIGIIGHFYGDCPDNSEKSYTIHEYETACSADIPRLMFVAPDTFMISASLYQSDESRRKQQEFRKTIKDTSPIGKFDSPGDLATGVVTALHNWVQVWNASRGARQPKITIKRISVLDSESEPSDDRGYLDHMLDIEENYKKLSEVLNGITSDTDTIRQHAIGTNNRIREALSNPSSTTPYNLRSIMKEYSEKLFTYADSMNAANAKYEDVFSKVDKSLEFVANFLKISNDNVEASQKLLQVLREAVSQAEVAQDSFRIMATILEEQPRIERHFIRASRQAASQALRLAQNADQTIASMKRGIQIIERKMDDYRGSGN